MTFRRRALVAPLLLLALHAPARADDVGADLETAKAAVAEHARQIEDFARALLTSDDDRRVAWGATWAREHGLASLEPELRSALRRSARRGKDVSFRTTFALLDALVSMDARLEQDELLPFVDGRSWTGRFAAAAVALAVRGGNPHVQRSLFDSLDGRDDSWEEAWLALGNVLAKAAPPGFYARLAGALEVRLQVIVVDHDRHGLGGSSLSTGSGDGRFPPVVGYPTVWRYDLTKYAGEGDVLLADGPRPIYLEREEVRVGFGSSRMDQDRTRERLAWIARRLEVPPESLPVQRKRLLRHDVRGELPLEEAVAAEKARIQDAFRQLLDRLVERDDLSDAEARGLAVRVVVEVDDRRSDTSTPLPDLR